MCSSDLHELLAEEGDLLDVAILEFVRARDRVPEEAHVLARRGSRSDRLQPCDTCILCFRHVQCLLDKSFTNEWVDAKPGIGYRQEVDSRATANYSL